MAVEARREAAFVCPEGTPGLALSARNSGREYDWIAALRRIAMPARGDTRDCIGLALSQYATGAAENGRLVDPN